MGVLYSISSVSHSVAPLSRDWYMRNAPTAAWEWESASAILFWCCQCYSIITKSTYSYLNDMYDNVCPPFRLSPMQMTLQDPSHIIYSNWWTQYLTQWHSEVHQSVIFLHGMQQIILLKVGEGNVGYKRTSVI